MKPDWKDAPKWAEWLAMDEDGIWNWFENKPGPYHEPKKEWLNENGGIYRCAATQEEDWTETLESRP